MKVGTDGTLLAAWARCPDAAHGRILDVGTGTGLCALIMAQRHPLAQVCAIDIDAEAVAQAQENILASPFAPHITACCQAVQTFAPAAPFDAIVCNPPFFSHSLTCPDPRRTSSRHTTTLTFQQLALAARRLLAPNGELSVIIPTDALGRMTEAAALAGLFLTRQCHVKTTSHKPPKRTLLAYTTQPPTTTEHTTITIGSEEYQKITQEIYR